MIKRLFVCIILLIVLAVTSSCTDKALIRKDLMGKPLVPEDFTFILGDSVYDAFAMKPTVDEWFTDGVWVNLDAFFSSEDPNMPGRWDLKTEEFHTDDVRYVYFEGVYYEIRKGKNGFTSIKNNAMTIRGIKIGDSIDAVFDAYGKTDWVKNNEDAWYSGWLGFQYKLFYNAEINGSNQEIYDSIKFELLDGKIVGIYYNFMNSDEI